MVGHKLPRRSRQLPTLPTSAGLGLKMPRRERREAPVTPRQRRQRLRRQRVHIPERPQSTPINDYLHMKQQQARLPGCTSVELEVSRALVSNRPVGEPIVLPLSAAEAAAAAAAAGVVQDDAVTRERREKWLADPAVKRRVDAYLSFVTAKANDLSFIGAAPHHISLSLNLSWLRLRKLDPLLVRDKALAARGAAWWEPGMASSPGAEDAGGNPADEGDETRGLPGIPPRAKEPPFCHDCRIVPAEIEFPRESTAVLAVALCKHCIGLREEERLQTVQVEQERLIIEVGFDPLEASEQARKKFPPRTHPGEIIEQAPPPPPNPKAAAAARLAQERERVQAADRAAEAARTTASEVNSIEALNLANNELASCEGLANSIRPFLFYSRCECLLLLDLSHNNISQLGSAFEHFPNLQMLYLQNNQLDNMSRVAPLATLRRLEKLTLNGNPLELSPPRRGEARRKRHDYRTRIIGLLPWLKQLDATTVTADEGFMARKTSSSFSSLGLSRDASSCVSSSLSELTLSEGDLLPGSGRGRSLSPTRRFWGSAC